MEGDFDRQQKVAARSLELKEDYISFNYQEAEVKKIRGRWNIIEGAHWIMDFDGRGGEAKMAFKIIQKYGFNHICFVGRSRFINDLRPSLMAPNPQMPRKPSHKTERTSGYQSPCLQSFRARWNNIRGRWPETQVLAASF